MLIIRDNSGVPRTALHYPTLDYPTQINGDNYSAVRTSLQTGTTLEMRAASDNTAEIAIIIIINAQGNAEFCAVSDQPNQRVVFYLNGTYFSTDNLTSSSATTYGSEIYYTSYGQAANPNNFTFSIPVTWFTPPAATNNACGDIAYLWYHGSLPPTDPYAGGGTSGPGGGDGDFDFTSTDIPIPPLPTIGAYDTGFLSLYVPTATELRAMASYMWSGAFDPNNFKKLFADPMDAVLGLHIIPCTASDPPTTPATLMIGNISTGLTMPRATAQYYELDCGTITVSAKWGAYLDYSPYSKLSLYLPYIGFVPISPDDCMRGSIRVVYHVDILSGSCTAFVYCVSNRGHDGHTLYTFTGACACDCPITEGQYTNAVLGILGIAGSAAGAVTGFASGNIGGAIASIGNVANTAISMAKPDVGRSGAFGGSAGLMGIQYPYLVLTVPRMCTPVDQNVYLGYPSLVTVPMEDITGYAQVEVTHLAGMSCTEEEAAEILELLHEGVIF